MTRLRRLVLVPVLAATLVVAGLAPAGPAQAQSLSEIEAQIEAAWRELEPLIEEYNKVRSELKANQERSDELTEQIAPLAEQVSAAQDELSDLAVRQYRTGPLSAFNALVASGSPTTFVDRLAMINQLAQHQQQQLTEANQAKVEFEEQKDEIDELIAEQEEQEAELAERADEIEEELEKLDELREQALQQPQQAPPPASSGDNGSSSGSSGSSGSCPAVASSGPGAVAAEFACSQVGKPYQWGASGPGSYDCSGLTQQAWAAAGVSLTHHTGAQWNEGRVVSRGEAIPGDLVFFYSDLSHMGIYIGNGLMVDAPRAGQLVGVRSIDIMPVSGFRRPG